jgi:hypothetical protein
MPDAGFVLLLATALIIGALVAGLAVIVVLLTRISTALGEASTHLGMIPDQLEPLAPAVGRMVDSIGRFREHAVGRP